MKKSDKNKLKSIINKIILESTNLGRFPDAPPRAGHLPEGYSRVLGSKSGLPEPWFEKLGYDQLDFPKADRMYDEKTDDEVPRISQSTTASSDLNTTTTPAQENELENDNLQEMKLRKIVRTEIKKIL